MPPASAPRTKGLSQRLSRAPGVEQDCPTSIHLTNHFTAATLCPGGVRGEAHGRGLPAFTHTETVATPPKAPFHNH